MPDRACVHCGQDGFPNRDALNYHVRRCSENKNPTCPKCGLHFVYARIHDHKANCGSWKEKSGTDEATAPRADAGTPEASAPEPAGAAGLLGIPADRLTDTDKLIVPLLAPPQEKPTPPPAKPEAPPADDSAAPVEPQNGGAELEGGLAGKFAERDAPRTVALAGLGDSLKRNWLILAVIAAVLAAVILWRYLSKREATQAALARSATPPPVQYRPNYNPETHGSLEQYRAAFGHLPTPGGA